VLAMLLNRGSNLGHYLASGALSFERFRFYSLLAPAALSASMDQARQREIASKGGQASHQKNMAQRFAADEAGVQIVAAKDDQSSHNENEYAQVDDQ